MVTEVVQRSGHLAAFRAAALLNAAAVLFQAVTAGQMLGGSTAGMHGAGAGAVHVLGLAVIEDDVPASLAREAIASIQVLGAFIASPAVREALADRLRSA